MIMPLTTPDWCSLKVGQLEAEFFVVESTGQCPFSSLLKSEPTHYGSEQSLFVDGPQKIFLSVKQRFYRPSRCWVTMGWSEEPNSSKYIHS